MFPVPIHLLVSFSLMFGGLSAKEVLEKVRKSYDSMKDASAEFDQVVQFKVSRLNQKLAGKIAIKKKDKMRLETEEQMLITDGTTSWTYSILNEKVIVDRFDPESSELSPSRFFIEFPKDFLIEVLGEENFAGMNTYKLKLTPKNPDNFIQEMKLWVDDDDWYVRQIEVSDINGSTTLYRLKQLQINKGIPDQYFQFSAPKNVEVIDLR
ncbi:MAG: outer membrane lipoprotein carrier protein LolA [Bacteroidetes bacterium]|nr:outer membrane lipoprotein carrier protein LolA [Bacteroidota bacterium]